MVNKNNFIWSGILTGILAVGQDELNTELNSSRAHVMLSKM